LTLARQFKLSAIAEYRRRLGLLYAEWFPVARKRLHADPRHFGADTDKDAAFGRGLFLRPRRPAACSLRCRRAKRCANTLRYGLSLLSLRAPRLRPPRSVAVFFHPPPACAFYQRRMEKHCPGQFGLASVHG
jgi:hypothetical protein